MTEEEDPIIEDPRELTITMNSEVGLSVEFRDWLRAHDVAPSRLYKVDVYENVVVVHKHHQVGEAKAEHLVKDCPTPNKEGVKYPVQDAEEICDLEPLVLPMMQAFPFAEMAP